MNTEISELSDEEILAISGGQIDPPARSNGEQYPEIENIPPP